MALAIGDAVPDFAFLRPDGTPWRLAEMTRPLVLIFLRHLA